METGQQLRGLFAAKPTHAGWELGDTFGRDGRRGAAGGEAGLPAGLLLQLPPCKGLRIPLYLSNSDKMSVTMATRENKLIREVSDIRNA